MVFQALPMPGDGDQYLDAKLAMPLFGAWNGYESAPLGLTGIDDDVYAAATLRNRGAGPALLAQDTLGAQLLHVDDLGTALTNLFGSGTAAIDGDTTLGALLSVAGAATLSDTLHGVGAVTFDDTLDVTGAGSFADTLDVTGDGTFGANVDITGNLTVGGTFTLTGALTANGAITLGNAAGDAISVLGTMTVTPLATFAGGITVSGGNLTFGTTAQRITGDLSNATLANRLMLQTSTANGQSFLGLLPNGTGIIASYQAYAAANPAASAYIQMAAVGGVDVRIQSDHNGAAYLPLLFFNNGIEQMRIAANGDITIAPAAGKIAFYGGTPVAQGAVGAAATDLASVITLANNLRTLVRNVALSS